MSSFRERVDLAVNFTNLERIEAIESHVQRIELYRHNNLGKILVINKEVQHVERWSSLYHEALVHIPSAFIREVRNVLILGGGSLFAASQALLYPTVRRCTLIDHDPAVLDLMARHYGHARAVMNDARFTHVNDDALEYLIRSEEKYDLVINDCFDVLAEFRRSSASPFKLMMDHVSPQGACADVIYRHIFEERHREETLTELSHLGSYALSLIAVPEYPGVLHLLACWGGKHISQELRTTRNLVQRSWRRPGSNAALEYYNPQFLPHYLYLPPYLRREKAYAM
ncbi:hypothetical protein ACQR0Z_30585 [Bradyrhizobium sp. HKCCYLS3077]|uniref:spermine/spermidine synthase domain-containing protein n=1 Tax=Bradyrhizobium sp. HKCCYLS3077 TaxID=3420761 RepID=UPI003EC017EC